MNPLHAFPEGSLVVVNLSLDHGVTTRMAEVVPLDSHSDAMTLQDVTGKELRGEIVSVRSMMPEEIEQWEMYSRICAYEAAERAADPDVMARTVMVLLAAARMAPRVVTVHREEVAA
jgi:hypothetical protein